MTGSLANLPATEAVARLARGEITSEALTAACLDRIAAQDGALGAFEHLDPAAALAAARGSTGSTRSPRSRGCRSR